MSPEDIYYDLDAAEAREQLLALALSGDHEAEFYLGHLAGEESSLDQTSALVWYRKSAAGGYLEAKHWMASLMYHGMGTVQDVAGAVALLRECAEAGLDSSCWKLGQHLLQFPESRDEAFHWLKLAASKGHGGAADLLAEADAP
jgi:uncharacterized protein